MENLDSGEGKISKVAKTENVDNAENYIDIPDDGGHNLFMAFNEELTNNDVNKEAIIHQWFDEKTTYGALVRNGRILIVDEIDDTRLTLSKCITELNKHQPNTIGVAVIHNKNKKKCYTIPNNITYIAGEIVNDSWIHYPWETTCEVDEI